MGHLESLCSAAVSMTEPRFGVLAEDKTDCDTVRVLARRFLGRDNVSVHARADNGCGTLRRKAERWMRDLARDGCNFIVIIHDLDLGRNMQLNDEAALRARLNGFEVPAGVQRTICIPVEEMEAWWWSDPKLIKRIGKGKGSAIHSPHLKMKPKEALQRLSCDVGGKPLYSTNDNPRLAEEVDLELCAQRCQSFADLRNFFVGVSSTVSRNGDRDPQPRRQPRSRVRKRSSRRGSSSR